MTSVIQIRKEVQDIKQQVKPKDDTSIFRVGWVWNYDAPHGKYQYQDVIMKDESIAEYKAPPPEDELALCREHYNGNIPKHARRLHDRPGEAGEDWRTFETYLKGQECRCGRFGHETIQEK